MGQENFSTTSFLWITLTVLQPIRSGGMMNGLPEGYRTARKGEGARTVEHTPKDAQQAWAKVAGVALLAVIVVGLVGSVLQAVGGSGSAAQNIMAHEGRYRVGLACEFVMLNNDILLAVALYGLLKRVNAPLALLGALWRFANAIVLGVGVVAALTGLKLLAAPQDPKTFPADQLQDLAGQFLHMHGVASPVGLLFWSMGAVVHSYLLWESSYIPRILSGGYLAVAAIIFFGCFAIMISPSVQAVIDPWFVLPDLPVELAVALWLTVKGANIQPSVAA